MAPPGDQGQNAPAPQRRSLRPGPVWVAIFLAVLALNVFLSTREMRPTPRVRVPYTPFFLNQVKAGHVESITSKGTAVQGTFTTKQSYQGWKPTLHFRTEIPTFADTDALSH